MFIDCNIWEMQWVPFICLSRMKRFNKIENLFIFTRKPYNAFVYDSRYFVLKTRNTNCSDFLYFLLCIYLLGKRDTSSILKMFVRFARIRYSTYAFGSLCLYHIDSQNYQIVVVLRHSRMFTFGLIYVSFLF